MPDNRHVKHALGSVPEVQTPFPNIETRAYFSLSNDRCMTMHMLLVGDLQNPDGGGSRIIDVAFSFGPMPLSALVGREHALDFEVVRRVDCVPV